jgi:endonuclease-3
MPGREPFVPSAASNRRRETQRKAETLKPRSVRASAIAKILAGAHPDLACPLAYRNTFELLIAVILSAQCTDAAVNRVTPALFRRYPTPQALGRASTNEIEPLIRTLGLFRAKAKALKLCAQQLVEEFGGQVPGTMEQLTRLPGVGRKTANVVLGHAFGKPGIAVDTHFRRVARRLGLTRHMDPVKIEKDVAKLLPPAEWTAFSHRCIVHGRSICHARNPACPRCPLFALCPSRRTTLEPA